MPKSMLINVILEEESRVAIVDNGVLDFFEIETLTKETLKGNIYKGVVDNVNASLEAAWVDCGWERPGFLPLDEVNFKVLPSVKKGRGSSRIQEHISPGMEVLVQVIRDRFNTKPPSLTTYYSLPGRYLVLLPFTDSSGVSRRIEDEKERAKLKHLIEDLRPPEKYGFIVRTAGLDQSLNELVRDLGYLIHLWETVERASSAARPPSLIYRERGLALRTIRDHLMDDVEEVLIDDAAVHESALRFIRAIAPHQEPRIKLYTGDKPLFTKFNLEDQIETIYKRRVPLKSGGEIVIEPTEAMTAIDVNSSKSREASVEELAFRTNLEAAAEVGRQLRLRDIGGLIVVDFIDMEQPKHLRAVEKVLFDAMKRDKAKFDVTKISRLGMLEISRQRLKAAKSTATYQVCAACDGAGSVRTTEAAAIAALRRIQTRVVRGDIATLTATAPTDVALYLMNQQRDELAALEKRYRVKIALIPRPDYPKERCDIETAPREGAAPAVAAQVVRPSRDEREQQAVAEVRSVRARREGKPARTGASARGGRAPRAERGVQVASSGELPQAADDQLAGSSAAPDAPVPAVPEAEANLADLTKAILEEDETAGGGPVSATGGAPSLPAAEEGAGVWGAQEERHEPIEVGAGPARAPAGTREDEEMLLEEPEATRAAIPAASDDSFAGGDQPWSGEYDTLPGNKHREIQADEPIETTPAPTQREPGAIEMELGAADRPETGTRKRRRRRGGRGRGGRARSRPAGSAVTPAGSASAGEEEEGHIVWEDEGESSKGSRPGQITEPAMQSRARSGSGGERQGRQQQTGASGVKKRRRRRREQGPAAGGPRAVPAAPAQKPGLRPQPQPAARTEDEDAPGGWWSRLVGPGKKRDDRDD